MEDKNKKTYKYSTNEIRDILDSYRQPSLIVRNRKNFGMVIPLTEEETIIGRDEDDVITIGDRLDGVSRKHAKFILQDNKVEIVDMDSHNGVYVNSRKIKSMELEGAETIILGRVILQFQYLNQNEIESYRSFSVDPLTGAFNKQYYMNHVEDIFEKCEKEKKPLSLIIIDVDNLKNINDTYGHIAGDYALATFGAIVRSYFKSDNYFYRFGGDEFIILLPNKDKEDALKYGLGLKARVDEHKFTRDGISLPFSLSIGVASKDELPGDSKSTSEMMRIADIRLYDSKNK
ncbi:MAG: GGDEF domain-containing protein [Candidatus Zixiibacteriota bacterium]